MRHKGAFNCYVDLCLNVKDLGKNPVITATVYGKISSYLIKSLC